MLKITQATDDLFEELQARIYIGYSYFYLKNYEASLDMFSIALERSSSEGLATRVAEANRGLAILYHKIGDEKRARKHIQDAESIFDTLDVQIKVGF